MLILRAEQRDVRHSRPPRSAAAITADRPIRAGPSATARTAPLLKPDNEATAAADKPSKGRPSAAVVMAAPPTPDDRGEDAAAAAAAAGWWRQDDSALLARAAADWAILLPASVGSCLGIGEEHTRDYIRIPPAAFEFLK